MWMDVCVYAYIFVYISPYYIGKAQASHAEGREFYSWSSQSNDLQNWYFSLPSQALRLGP